MKSDKKMKWFVVYLLFAQQTNNDDDNVLCESCDVLFRARLASEAYDKADKWGKNRYSLDSNFKFLGIEHVHEINNEKLVSGTEIGGKFFKIENVWERINEIIPEKSEMGAIIWEENQNTPIGEFISEEQKLILRKVFQE